MQLKGKLVPIREIPVFDDKRSFILAIDSATTSIRTDALAHVVNDHVLAAENAPVEDLVVSIEGDDLNLGEVYPDQSITSRPITVGFFSSTSAGSTKHKTRRSKKRIWFMSLHDTITI